MLDRNGVEITTGATATILSPGLDLEGRTGTVGRLKDQRVRVDGPPLEGYPAWGAWCRPTDVAVLPAAGPESRATGDGGTA